MHWSSRESSSAIIPEVRPLSAFPAGWGKEQHGHLQCQLPDRLCPELTHTLVPRCAWCDAAFTPTCCTHSGHGQSPASMGVFSEGGHLLFRTCGHLWGCFMSSTGGWKQRQVVPKHQTVFEAVPAGTMTYQILTLVAVHSLCPPKYSLPGITTEVLSVEQPSQFLGHKLPSSPASCG